MKTKNRKTGSKLLKQLYFFLNCAGALHININYQTKNDDNINAKNYAKIILTNIFLKYA